MGYIGPNMLYLWNVTCVWDWCDLMLWSSDFRGNVTLDSWLTGADDGRWQIFWRLNQQGLVTVPFWEYWTSPYSSHGIDNIPFMVGWCDPWGHQSWPMDQISRSVMVSHRSVIQFLRVHGQKHVKPSVELPLSIIRANTTQQLPPFNNAHSRTQRGSWHSSNLGGPKTNMKHRFPRFEFHAEHFSMDFFHGPWHPFWKSPSFQDSDLDPNFRRISDSCNPKGVNEWTKAEVKIWVHVADCHSAWKHDGWWIQIAIA